MYTRLVKQNGVIKIDLDGRIIEPLAFRSFRPTNRNISDFSDAGVKIMNIFTTGLNSALGLPYSLYGESWTGSGKYDFTAVDSQIELFIKNAPSAYFGLKIQVDTRPWFLHENPDIPDTFTHLSQAAADSRWREGASSYLKELIKHVESRYGDKIFAYFILGGATTEWFSRFDNAETHPVKEKAYKKYMNDPGIGIPCKEIRERCSAGSFRDPVLDREAVDYWRFHNELVADTILFFAGEAQSVIRHNKLLGVYFGYIFELNGENLWNWAHLAYEKIYLSGDIDLIATPSSYQYRKHDSTSAVMIAYDTLALHNKLQFLSFDHITYLAPQYIEAKSIPGYNSKLEDEKQTIDVLRRDFIYCITKGSGHWWFDMFEGWFYSKGLMDEIKKEIDAGDRLLDKGLSMASVAEIAVFVEGAESLYYVDKNAGLNTDLLSRQREGLARMGAPFDVYSICDIDNPGIDHNRYKLYIFLDQFKITKKTRNALNNKIARDNKTILWLYAPGYVDDNRLSSESISYITGMNIKLKTNNSSEAESLVEPDYSRYKSMQGICPDDRLKFNNKVKTLFYVDDDTAEVWGRYSADGKTAIASKKIIINESCGDQGRTEYNSFYSAVGNLPAWMLRNIAATAGVHIFNYGNDPVYINKSLIGVYSTSGGSINLILRDDARLDDVFGEGTYKPENNVLKLGLRKGESRLFMIKES